MMLESVRLQKTMQRFAFCQCSTLSCILGKYSRDDALITSSGLNTSLRKTLSGSASFNLCSTIRADNIPKL